MDIAVWDTYVHRTDGLLMHFDILVSTEVQESNQILEYAIQFLASKGLDIEHVEVKKCQFCHIESATDMTVRAIEGKGFDIIEFENCN
ncbi:MAG: DUF2024 family protein [Reichenbachiella sp.]|uniref:DUF2024 family protein n=1 Tax=Reichenbachiella sp. TaxID=2184521 RepID=UPI0032971AAC